MFWSWEYCSLSVQTCAQGVSVEKDLSDNSRYRAESTRGTRTSGVSEEGKVNLIEFQTGKVHKRQLSFILPQSEVYGLRSLRSPQRIRLYTEKGDEEDE